MKSWFVLMFSLVFFSCHSSREMKINVSNQQIETEEKIPSLAENVFQMGNAVYFTDSCAFYFECDCCDGDLIFNRDSTFYYFGYCMSDVDMRTGNYSVQNNTVQLYFSKYIYSDKYNYEFEFDSTVIQYFHKDTLIEPLSINYNISMCNGKTKLQDKMKEWIAIETSEKYSEIITLLEQEGIIARLRTHKE